jgi:hypothetical protein
MKIANVVGTAMLLMLFGVAAPAYAQEPRDDPAKPDQPKEQPKDKEKDKDKEQPKKQEEAPKNPKEQPAAKPPKAQQRPEDKDNKENREATAPRDEHARSTEQPSHNGQQAHGDGRIPDDKYRAHFGREHTFHVGHPQVVGGQPQFQYGGYSFVIAQAWPAGWGYDDEVYIIDVDGVYYLVDVVHPGVQLALTVVL